MSKNKEYTYCVDPHGMLPEAYEEIVFEYISYYRRRAKFYKRMYIVLTVIKIMLLAIIPITQVLDTTKSYGWISAVASSLCIMLETIGETFHMRKKWILYQHTINLLMSEQRIYKADGGEYSNLDEEDKFTHYVNNVERILNSESSDWRETVNSCKEKSNSVSLISSDWLLK